jgi:hypothetical protein
MTDEKTERKTEKPQERTVELRESFTKSFTPSGDSVRSFHGEPSEPTALPSDLPFSIDLTEPAGAAIDSPSEPTPATDSDPE